jgi:G:T/U-mismatch repair DNA glycosylase
LERQINPETETLLIGTFNPAVEGNDANFFYSRGRNYLWELLPACYNEKSLKEHTRKEKEEFCKNSKIDFIDLVQEVLVEANQETNYSDDYLDYRVSSWNDVIGEIAKLSKIKRVGFTRKTFANIPNITKKIQKIEKYCLDKNIYFQYLVTPSRFTNGEKQKEYKDFLSQSKQGVF